MAKKVWGIVLIVVAVLTIMGSFHNYREASTYEDVIFSLSGAVPGIKKTANVARAEIRNDKALSIAGIGIGIILAVVGTWLLSNIAPNRYIVRIEDAELEAEVEKGEKSVRWKF
jgi:hypothetical protein